MDADGHGLLSPHSPSDSHHRKRWSSRRTVHPSSASIRVHPRFKLFLWLQDLVVGQFDVFARCHPERSEGSAVECSTHRGPERFLAAKIATARNDNQTDHYPGSRTLVA